MVSFKNQLFFFLKIQKKNIKKIPERHFSLERPPGLKLILKVGNNSTPDGTPEQHGGTPAYGIQSDNSGIYMSDYPEKHKKSKKKKKKKDREKKHKHHHKEKRRHHRDDSSQEDVSIGEDSSHVQENILRFGASSTTHSLAAIPVTKPFHSINSPTPPPPIIDEQTNVRQQIPILDSPPTNSLTHQKTIESPTKQMFSPIPAGGDTGAREPRTCVLKLKQSKSTLSKLLDHLLRSLEKKDPHQFFAWPVTDDIAPGYSAIISKAMDFSTIRQKIDENSYTTLLEFSDDFKLMCENAIKYNHVDTVYHKAAKRLLHVGARLLQPENLMRSLRPLMNYMRELSPKELGFELPEHHDNDNQNMDSADEGVLTGAEEGMSSQAEEDEKRKIIRLENNPKTHFEAFVDDMSAEEILEQVQNSARNAKNRISNKRNHNKMGFIRQNKEGTTTMKILLDSENDTPERVISLGAFTGKLQQGTGQLQAFREDRRNIAKIVKPLNYGAFSSFAPVYDSRFSNLSKEETELVLNTYGDETAVQYAESITEFSKDSLYAGTLANGLLDILTGGEHRKSMGVLIESQRQRYENKEVEKSFPDHEDESSKYENVKIDFDSLKSLSKLGMDVSFLENVEQTMKVGEIQKKIQSVLNINSSLIERLHQVQHERLSQPLPAHLSHVAKPNNHEIQLAVQLTSNLSEIAKQLTPRAISSAHALRKAMGVGNVGLEQFVPQRMTLAEAIPISNNSNLSKSVNAVGELFFFYNFILAVILAIKMILLR